MALDASKSNINIHLCPFCLTNAGTARTHGVRNLHVVVTIEHKLQINCRRCGNFAIFPDVFERLSRLTDSERLSLIVFIDSAVESVSPGVLELEPTIFDQISRLKRPSVTQQADKILAKLVNNNPRPNQHINFLNVEYLRAGNVLSFEEMVFFRSHLRDLGLVDGDKISPKGFERVEGSFDRSDSRQGFVAMWFNPDLSAAWLDGFAQAISDAGWTPQRIDQKEHVNKICDEIILEIRRSKFLVADFTGHRGGVYYEAGFASGLGIPVIYTCRKGDLKKLHFDIRQYNCIDWTTPEELRTRLHNRIGAVIGLKAP